MIAVADTSPICYLILIGEIDLLPKIFSQVLAPQAVLAELLHEDAPAAARGWASNLPSWICVKELALLATSGLEKLQAGEQAAILLAESIKADIILLDEKAALRIGAANVDTCQQAGVSQVCIPQRGGQKTAEQAALERSRAFKQGQRFRVGIEGRILIG